MPAMRLSKTSYGMGTKDFPAANCVRAMLGRETNAPAQEILELSCNLDDMHRRKSRLCDGTAV